MLKYIYIYIYILQNISFIKNKNYLSIASLYSHQRYQDVLLQGMSFVFNREGNVFVFVVYCQRPSSVVRRLLIVDLNFRKTNVKSIGVKNIVDGNGKGISDHLALRATLLIH